MVERTFLSAHIHETETSESCVGVEMIDSLYVQGDRPVAPTRKTRRNPFFRLHSGRRSMRRADRNVCPTFPHTTPMP